MVKFELTVHTKINFLLKYNFIHELYKMIVHSFKYHPNVKYII